MKKENGVIKAALVIIMLFSTLQRAGAIALPVVDAANLAANGRIVFVNSRIASEEAAATAELTKAYKQQLKQYATQLKNTKDLKTKTYIWDRTTDTVNNLIKATDTLSKLGNLQAYLDKFQNLDYYNKSPCFSPSGCSDAEWKALQAKLQQNRLLASAVRKQVSDAILQGVNLQQDQLKADASTLHNLQVNAQTAQGRMEAIQYAIQFASNQTNQLVEIRSLLVNIANALATNMQTSDNKKSLEQAASQDFLRGTFKASDPHLW